MVIRPGRAPIRSSGGYIRAALRILRSLGTSAHVWLPGANGVSVASLPSNNYLLSDGSTGYSTVDGVDGLTLDAMGSLGAELVTNGTFATNIASWSVVNGATLTWDAGQLKVVNNGAYGAASQSFTTVAGNTYVVVLDITSAAYTNVQHDGGFILPTAIRNGTGFTAMFVATVATTTLSVVATGTAYFDNISVKEYTGTHLTQPTTANKPLVRRGAYNLIARSEALSTAPWSTTVNITITDAQAANAGGQLTLCKVLANASGGANVIQIFTSSATALTMRFLCRIGNIATRGNLFSLYNDSTASELARFTINYSTGAIAHSIGSGATATDLGGGLWEVKLTQTTGLNAGNLINIYGGYIGNTATAGDFAYIGEYQVEAGTSFTTYTPTTTTAASNPSAGKYWWSFDGSNGSLLSGNLGITNACTIVIAGRVNSAGIAQYFFGEDANGVHLYVNSLGRIFLYKGGVGTLVDSGNGVIVSGVPFVITCRLSSGTAVIRKNGVQVATAASGLTFSAVTGARIGSDFAGTSYPLNGALGWVVPIAAALSDADCLTVERLVGQQFPGAPVF